MAAPTNYEALASASASAPASFDVNIVFPKDDAMCNQFTEAELLPTLEKAPYNMHCAVPWRDWPTGANVFEVPFEMMKKSRCTIFLLCEAFLNEFGIMDRGTSGNVIIIKVGQCEVPSAWKQTVILDYTNEQQRPHVMDQVIKHLRMRSQTDAENLQPADDTQDEFEPVKPDNHLQRKGTFHGTYVRSAILPTDVPTGGQ